MTGQVGAEGLSPLKPQLRGKDRAGHEADDDDDDDDEGTKCQGRRWAEFEGGVHTGVRPG